MKKNYIEHPFYECPHCGGDLANGGHLPGCLKLGRRLACGCVLGYERCVDCRPGLHPDQEKAVEITIALRNGEQEGKQP